MLDALSEARRFAARCLVLGACGLALGTRTANQKKFNVH